MIRAYRSGDRDALIEITTLAFDGVSVDHSIEKLFGGPIHGVSWQQRKARHIDADIAANPKGIFVFETGGTAVGYITCRFDLTTLIGWIPNFAVHPDHQGRGIGRQLMEAAIAYLRGHGMTCIRIETLEQNTRCTRFYPSLGFQEIAHQIHYIMRL